MIYDPFYRRLKLFYFLNELGINEELKLPFCSVFNETNISNSSFVSKYEYQSGKYKSSILKQVNRRSPITIKGIICDDLLFKDHLPNMGLNYEYKTLDYYLYAINNLYPTVMYAFDGSTGVLNIESLSIDSIGVTRNFEITGHRSC